jgi:hypothetical protein
VAEIVSLGGMAIAVQANVAKKDEIERLFSQAKIAFGKIDGALDLGFRQPAPQFHANAGRAAAPRW